MAHRHLSSAAENTGDVRDSIFVRRILPGRLLGARRGSLASTANTRGCRMQSAVCRVVVALRNLTLPLQWQLSYRAFLMKT